MTPKHRRHIEERHQAAPDPAKCAEVIAAADPALRGEVEPLSTRDSAKKGTLDRPAWRVWLDSPARIRE
jgi:hypothetical protein